MKTTMKLVCLLLTILLGGNTSLKAQTTVTESGASVQKDAKECPKPRDGFYDRYLHKEKMPIAYDYIHEKDVFWEKRIWRVVDTREKMNHSFRNPKAPFINILVDAAMEGKITLYSTWDDEFSTTLNQEEITSLMSSTDTISIYDPITFEDSLVVVTNEMDPEDITKFRIKEVWFFDEETSSMGVRILGIAPIITRYAENGAILNEGAMFWAYYPELRNTLAKVEVFNPMNDAARLSWDDLFEARLFSSYIVKESNIHDRRIKDYVSNEMNGLLESERIHSEIFNFEHDLWSY